MNKSLETVKIWVDSKRLLKTLAHFTGKSMVRVMAESLILYKQSLKLSLSADEQALIKSLQNGRSKNLTKR